MGAAPLGDDLRSQWFRVATYRFRRTFHRDWGSYLAIALLVGLIGGLGMASVAGARRTESAFPNVLVQARASNLDIQVESIAGSSSNAYANDVYSPRLIRTIRHLPRVRAVAAKVNIFLAPLSPKGTAALPPALQNNQVIEIGSVDGEEFSQDRVIADQGRLPDPRRENEFAASPAAAQLLHWHLGQTISFGAYTFAQVATPGTGAPSTPPSFRIRATLVGIVVQADDVVHDEVDQYPTALLFTPALTNRVIGIRGAGFGSYDLRLAHGNSDVATVEREFVGNIPPGSIYAFHVTSVVEDQVERAIKPESIALGTFGLIAVLATLLITGQVIGRRLRTNTQDFLVLRAIGADRVVTIIDSLFGVFGAVVIGGLLAGALCVALSPLSPIGTIRQIDPAPGLNFDWTVLGAGMGLFVVGLGSIALAIAFLGARRASDPGALPVQGTSRIVNGAIRLGLPAPAITGIRFAVERGRGPNAVPVGSALLGAALAVAVVVTTITFGSGLNTLVSNPRLYGWNWNYAIEEEGGGDVPPLTVQMLRHDPDVAAMTGYSFANAELDDVTVPILLSSSHAALSPPVLDGHAVDGPRQVVLGGTTLAQLHKHVGDFVTVSYGTRRDAPVYVPPTRMKIVGTATLPAIGATGTLHTSMGTGAIIPTAVEPAAFRHALSNPDPNLTGPNVVVVRLRNGTPVSPGAASLQRIVNATTRLLDADPNSGGAEYVLLSVQQPAEIVNYKTMGATPAILASGLAVGAVGALGLTLVASVRRRRRDLALLKTVGFMQRQLASVIAWQASVAALIGVLVGIPVGIIVGRSLWVLFAHEIYAVPDSTVPVLQIVLVTLGALVLANLVAALPGRIAARTPTAVLLRAE